MFLHTVQPYNYARLYYYIFTNTQAHHFINYYLNNCKIDLYKTLSYHGVWQEKLIFSPIRVVGKHSNHIKAKILLKTMLLSKSDRHVIDTFEAVADLPVTQSNQL